MAEGGASVLESADIMRLLRLLPHRYPFLLVDRIVDIDSDNSAVGIKNVTVNEPHFQGHFPEQPVMPGVLIIEAMAQTAGAICLLSTGGNMPSLVYFLTIDNAKFRKPVVPGDRLRFEIDVVKKRAPFWKMQGKAFVETELVCEAEVTAMVTEEQAPT